MLSVPLSSTIVRLITSSNLKQKRKAYSQLKCIKKNFNVIWYILFSGAWSDSHYIDAVRMHLITIQ